MCCNLSKTSLKLLQPSKRTEASKLFCIHRVALWLEMSPNVPFITQISTLTWAVTCVEHGPNCWHARATCTCVRPRLCPNKYQQQKKNRNGHTTAQNGLRDHDDKINVSIIVVISVVLLECVLEPKRARWASVVTTGPIMTSIFPWRDREITPHQQELHHQQHEYHNLYE